MAEKPGPDRAFSDLGILGRYVFTPQIFEAIRNTPVMRGARSRSPTPSGSSWTASRSTGVSTKGRATIAATSRVTWRGRSPWPSSTPSSAAGAGIHPHGWASSWRPGACWIGWGEWRGAESNRRRKDFQSFALPTELPRHYRRAIKYIHRPVQSQSSPADRQHLHRCDKASFAPRPTAGPDGDAPLAPGPQEPVPSVPPSAKPTGPPSATGVFGAQSPSVSAGACHTKGDAARATSNPETGWRDRTRSLDGRPLACYVR